MSAQVYSDAQLLATLRVLAQRRGRPPTSREWDRHVPHPVHSLLIHRFGSWQQALDLAGVSEPRAYTAQETRLIAGLTAVVGRRRAQARREEA